MEDFGASGVEVIDVRNTFCRGFVTTSKVARGDDALMEHI
jgi:hypothetical protein